MIPEGALTVEEQAEADYRRWVDSWTWHLDQIPGLLDAMLSLAAPRVGVSRGGSRFDRPQVTGGGHFDNLAVLGEFDSTDDGEIVDAGARADAVGLWSALSVYTATVGERTGLTPPIGRGMPDSAPRGRTASLTATGWLVEHVEQIVDHPDLAPLEDSLFGLVRRARARYTAGTVRRARPRTCVICGSDAVVVDWVDGANGSPKPVRVGVCRVCGQQYQANEEEQE